MKLKGYLFEVLNNLLTPIREKRSEYAQDKAEVMRILFAGTEKTREVAAQTMNEVRQALKLNY